eukprot:TRINITY_DN4362_c0_g1_i1.p1 TRINITY_DN4362_c0_g1~~TRINITY_DN4362_c0_g1_i1.p1  ORF type:complete len:855 (+),score=237.93 TRINITY_DN4362_c0_g1_i1:325-2889(+)
MSGNEDKHSPNGSLDDKMSKISLEISIDSISTASSSQSSSQSSPPLSKITPITPTSPATNSTLSIARPQVLKLHSSPNLRGSVDENASNSLSLSSPPTSSSSVSVTNEVNVGGSSSESLSFLSKLQKLSSSSTKKKAPSKNSPFSASTSSVLSSEKKGHDLNSSLSPGGVPRIASPSEDIGKEASTSSTALLSPEIPGMIRVQITIEDYEELKSARTVTLRLGNHLTVRDMLHKVALKGNVYIIASNYSYGDNNYDLVLLNETEDIILPKDTSIAELMLNHKSNIVLRKKVRDRIPIIIAIDCYALLQSAKQVVANFFPDEPVVEVLHKVARKHSVNIPIREEYKYGLYWWNEIHKYAPATASLTSSPGRRASTTASIPAHGPGTQIMSIKEILESGGTTTLMETSRTLGSYGAKPRDVIYLCKRPPSDLETPPDTISVQVEIEDFEELNCAKKTSSRFNLYETADEVLEKIARKGTVNITGEVSRRFELADKETEVKLDPKKSLKELDLKNNHVLILRKRIDDDEESKPQTKKNRIIGSTKNPWLNKGTEADLAPKVKGAKYICGVRITGKIGQGTFGKVYKGLYEGKECAIKILKEMPDQKHIHEFNHEVDILRKTDCPFIVKLFTTVEEPRQLAIVMEFASRGSLFHVLNSELYEIGWDRIFAITIDMVKGINYLHERKPDPIVHRDLKSLNILVTDNWDIKICDFGLARLKNGVNQETLRKLRSTPAWSPPELLDEVEYTTKSDVYSIGIIMWEVIYRCIKGKYERPFFEFKEITQDYQLLMQTHNNSKRPTIPPSCPETMASLCNQCWDNDPSKRPNCEELLESLLQIQLVYEENKNEWDRTIGVRDSI